METGKVSDRQTVQPGALSPVQDALMSQRPSRIAESYRCVEESFTLLAQIRALEDRMSRPRPPLAKPVPASNAER
jgi:hypothetical protein